MILIPEFETIRFFLRPLSVKDVSDRYVAWFKDPQISQNITYASTDPTLAKLKRFVIDREQRDDILFLGIFERIYGLHIGNIKFEPINSKLGYAIMGILIGDTNWQGKGVAQEVIIRSADWLQKNRNIDQIVLGVSRLNVRAIAAYRKVGFVEKYCGLIPTDLRLNMTMIWDLNTTKNPVI
jgi:RimJ/RimL family protein N-acetyltransferase